MRIRFRASDFGEVAKNKSRSCKSKQASFAKPDAEMVLGSFVLFARVIQQLGFWIEKIQTKADYCYVWHREETRRVRFARPWTQASKPALTDASLAVPRRFTWRFFSTKRSSPAR